ncbi:hypothetical protein ARMGADRAFT_479091 [Armillaria gallica]|uniref:Uncharacterized protein n=1 Tax=Armillaria gallica TaxID=47427 RepID=A0A2H3D7B8_ARMGA|nr:hypothetical protein ARMGADRAFT_479091 [Armillaria gallica]
MTKQLFETLASSLFPPTFIVLLPQQSVLSTVSCVSDEYLVRRKTATSKLSSRICAETMYHILASSMQGTAANLGRKG